MSHPVVLGLFPTVSTAAEATRGLHALGLTREHISIVARDHAEARALAEQMDATPGVELEDSRPAGRLGELAGSVLATVAFVLPGMGPIVAAGPLSAELGEAAGHAVGSLPSVLTAAGVPAERADVLQREIGQGAVLVGAHVADADVDRVRERLSATGATQIDIATWS